jgi:beta-glucosidase
MPNQEPFFWGSATSSHQIEGNNTANDWWVWEQQGKLKEASGPAADHYSRYLEDFDILTRLGHTAYRFSLEWSRFEPEENKWNEDAFEFYEKIFQELKARSIEPIVTLHHFTNPQWYVDKGGWINPRTAEYFVRFTEKVVKRYGKYVRFWVTINEPLVYLYHGFYAGLWPPGEKSFKISMQVFRNQLAAHTEAYRAIHQIYENEFNKPVWVSVAQHMSHFSPCRSKSLKDQFSLRLRNWFFNYLFLDSLITGFLFFPGIFCEFLPARNTLDYIGLNYYTRDFIKFKGIFGIDSLGDICEKAHHMEDVKEFNMMGWEVYPDGLYWILKGLAKYKLPIFITENGIATEDDTQRVRFIQNHLASVQRAKAEGVPVHGYFYWSLLDNFEWAHGFGPRFGVVDVNYQTFERKIRPSAYVLSEMCRKIESGTLE